MDAMLALVARLEAKPTKEQEVAELLSSDLWDAEGDPNATVWFAVRFGVLEFGLFMAYPDEVGRQNHLPRKVAAALKDNDHLFEETPELETADVLAARLPASLAHE
ncbi:antibiotic biosynthesis monooxygenase [Mycolicibacterium sp. 120270]|uniref:antibiotic biosynthesis monooxygenase n=1 Tax=Mycolicibacterium sp. 120270 TaxID=3090600 RepID=UPI00299F0082|nr:antibiotic biosynthesis monooxygenase [Mycolicibacterium sp. 120270]MDX1882554.1 antibiotic biosynthesis monooxygenase [Mycolicibacterium sp. 120270]